VNDEADMLVLLKMISTLEKKLEQTEADRDTLAAEVEAWRYDVPCDTTDLVASDGTLTRLGELVKLTDASGALTRAKEDK
jgi:hypothetical protein